MEKIIYYLLKLLNRYSEGLINTDGHGYYHLSLAEYTIDDDGINILIAYESDISGCRDKKGYHSIELDRSFNVKKTSYTAIYFCDKFDNKINPKYISDKGKNYLITDSATLSDNYDGDIIGNFSIIDSKVIVEKKWKYCCNR